MGKERERERDAAGRPERHEWNVQIRRVDIVPRCFVLRASRHALGQLTLLLAHVFAERFFIRQHAHHQPKWYY